MIDWGLMVLCIIMMLLGFFELYRTFKFYKWDKKAKILPTKKTQAPLAKVAEPP